MTNEQQCEKCKEKDKKIRKLQARNRKLREDIGYYLDQEEERLNPTSQVGIRNKEALEKAAREDYEAWRSS